MSAIATNLQAVRQRIAVAAQAAGRDPARVELLAASKSGCAPAALAALCRAIRTLPQLRWRGLMAIPAASNDLATQHAPFRQLRQLFSQLRTDGLPLDTLSMGMSHDLETAIAEGASIVRIGTAIFGEREQP